LARWAKKRCTQLTTASDKAYHSPWFSLGTPVSSTTKTGRHDIAEILLKVVLKHQPLNQIKRNLAGMGPFQNCVQQLRPPFKMAAVTKNKNYSITHCCFSISQNELKF
jgi:hypothetical protein